MIVMPSNSNKLVVGYLAGKYPRRLGHLYGPGGFRGPYPFLPFAIDNGRYASTINGYPWDEEAFLGLLTRVMDIGVKPAWVVVPDVVGDAEETMREWDKWASRLKGYGWPLAMAVQDGMKPKDIPEDADVIFVGGTPTWKRSTIYEWCEAFEHVHIGAINTEKWLWECHRAGAESCDGTGWFRGDKKQLQGLFNYLERSDKELGEANQPLPFVPQKDPWNCPQCDNRVTRSYNHCRCGEPRPKSA